MPKASDILGMNARQTLFLDLNPATAKAYCNSKYATKVLLINKGIATAEVYGVLATIEDVNSFEWSNLNSNFVIKPTNGNAGKGVIGFKKQHLDKTHWTDMIGQIWSLQDIKIHCLDILEGQYSTYGSDHKVIIEERIDPHPKLRKYSYRGTPDVRVIVFNKVPIMAMLRLPTKESEGRANQTQGAIAVGIDIASGVTTYATAHKDNFIQYLPGTKKKLNGIKIPFWKKLLKVAIEATDAAGLYYSGVDLFIDEEKGPMVVELNANPGLSIQIANKAGLRKRLERVQDINVSSAEHGVRIGQALFAESFSDKIKAEEGLTILAPLEEVAVYGDGKHVETEKARINTGRYRSAISGKLAESLGLVDLDDLLWFQNEGGEGKVPVVEVRLKLKDRKVSTAMVVSKKLNKMAFQIDIGRKDLSGFLVSSESE